MISRRWGDFNSIDSDAIDRRSGLRMCALGGEDVRNTKVVKGMVRCFVSVWVNLLAEAKEVARR
jgi:hypothetical protein